MSKFISKYLTIKLDIDTLQELAILENDIHDIININHQLFDHIWLSTVLKRHFFDFIQFNLKETDLKNDSNGIVDSLKTNEIFNWKKKI